MNWATGAGLAIVAGSHVYMYVYRLPDDMMDTHVFVNLGASALILWGTM